MVNILKVKIKNYSIYEYIFILVYLIPLANFIEILCFTDPLFRDREIQWFHPQSKTKLEEDDLQDLESEVYDL